MLLKSNIEELTKIVNSSNILSSKEECYCYSTDASNFPNDIHQPDAVVFAESIEQVQEILKYANSHKIPVISRGAGTNMVGACTCNTGGIILNFSKMNKIIEINPINMTATVQPGVILGYLKSKVDEFGLFFPPDPSNFKVSTIGGAIAQSSGGALSFKYGTTKDYILSLKVVTASGELLTLGARTTKDSVGYHLGQLIVGSEGTLGVIVETTLKLIPKPQTSSVIVAYYNSVEAAVSSVNEILVSGIYPAAIEFMDKNAVITIESYVSSRFKTIYDCVLLIELDGNPDSVNWQTNSIVDLLKNESVAKIYIPPTKNDYERIWNARRSSFAASARLAPDVISDDIIVPRENMPLIVRKCNELSERYSLNMCLVGHIGDGNLHPQIVLNADNDEEFKNYMNLKSELYAYVAELGGTISAEHGVGVEKRPYLNKLIDENVINYMKMIKRVFDPNNILNPGKIFKMDGE